MALLVVLVEVPEVPLAVAVASRVVVVAVVRVAVAAVGQVLQTRVVMVRTETVLGVGLLAVQVVHRAVVPVATRILLVMPAVEEVPAVSMAAAAGAVQLPPMPAAAAVAAVQTRSPALTRPIHKQLDQLVLGRATVIIRPVPVMVVQAARRAEITGRLVREGLS